jgi:hypothetical protein
MALSFLGGCVLTPPVFEGHAPVSSLSVANLLLLRDHPDRRPRE